MTRTQKIPAKKLYKSKVQVNKKRNDIKLLVICSEIPTPRSRIMWQPVS